MRTRVLASVFVVLASLAGVLMSGANTASATDVDGLHTVDQYVAALRKDPVLVQQMMGAGHTDAVRLMLTERAEKLPYPVHIALVQNPTDLQSDDITRDLASAIRRRLGAPGLYIVASPGAATEILVSGSEVDQTLLHLAYYDVLTAVSARVPPEDERRTSAAQEAQAVLEVAASPGMKNYEYQAQRGKPVLTAAQVDEIARAPWGGEPSVPDREYGSHVGKRWMVGTVTGLSIFLVVGTSLVGWPGWRRTTDRPANPGRPTLEALRREAEQSLTALAEGLAASPQAPAHPELVLDAQAAREAAEAVLGGSYLDVIGALVLSRSGLADVGRAQAEKPGKPYRSCYFDPLHGQSTTTASWRYGDAAVDVPVCRRCARAVASGRTPEILRVGDGVRSRAYFEESSVWSRTGYGALVEHFGPAVLRDREQHS